MVAAMSACDIWVSRTSCVLTTEIPIEPPMLRDRLSSAAPVVLKRAEKSLERERLQWHEDQPEPKALDHAADDYRPRRLVDREAGHHVQRHAHQDDADTHQQPRVDLAGRRPAISIENNVPTPRGAVRKPDWRTE